MKKEIKNKTIEEMKNALIQLYLHVSELTDEGVIYYYRKLIVNKH